MSKKLPLILVFTLFACVTYAQTIVSTSPENQNVVLEEFTGIHCVFCPSGHSIAKAIQDANPDRVSLINIHQGSFSNPGPGEPDFRTAYGNAIVAQSYSGSGFGYPSGTVNRHVFPGRSMASGGGTAMGRNYWSVSANETLAKPSSVNVGVEAEIDITTNILTVHVEAYYTSDSPESTNMLNVALLQNNTKGPQTGGNLCDEYNHMHRLVEMITGQWGEEITTTTSGSFVDRTYTYTIPANFKNVPVEIADMEVVAFMTETQQEISSGNRAHPTYTQLLANDASLKGVSKILDPCANYLAPQIVLQNKGQNSLTSLEIHYSVNGGTVETYNWNGNLDSMQYEAVDLPGIRFDIQANNTLLVSIENDDDPSNNSISAAFDKAYDATTTVNMELKTDQYGSECRWNITDYDGNIIYNGGPYGANQTINETFTLPSNCYTFNIIDTYGDGGGPVKLIDTDSNNTVFYQTDGKFGCGESTKFSTDGFVLGVAQTQLNDVVLYPNPARTILNLRNAENANIQVFDVLGKMLFSVNNISMDEQIDVAKLQTGTYFMKISKDNIVITKRFLVSK